MMQPEDKIQEIAERAERLQEIGSSILRAARDELYLGMRFLDVALSSFSYQMDGQVHGFGTDGRVMYFQPQMLGGLYRENRILVKEGLCRLKNTKNQGLQELIRANSLEDAKITAYHIGFVLGPCINASGRLDTAARSLALLNAKTKEEAARLAGDLTALNQSRKALTEKGKEEEFAFLELLEERAIATFGRVKNNGKTVSSNIDFYSGFVYEMIGLPQEIFTPLFAMARIVGWCAHRNEELNFEGKRIIRPAYKNVLDDLAYIPIKKR